MDLLDRKVNDLQKELVAVCDNPEPKEYESFQKVLEECSAMREEKVEVIKKSQAELFESLTGLQKDLHRRAAQLVYSKSHYVNYKSELV